MFWAIANGSVTSSTVTVAFALAELPLVSVANNETVLSPTFAQMKLLGVAIKLARFTSSELPLSMSAPIIEALPITSS